MYELVWCTRVGQSLAAATRDVFAPLLTAWRQHLLGQAAAVAAPIAPIAPIASVAASVSSLLHRAIDASSTLGIVSVSRLCFFVSGWTRVRRID
jgi:hypothetical protein